MLVIENLSFGYGSEPVIKNIDLTISEGAHLSVIGESGCGKSTLLKLIYGNVDAGTGSVTFNNTLIQGPKYKLIAGHDDVKFLTQDFGLMPYITVAENVGKYLSNVNKLQKKRRIIELLELVGMEDFFDVKGTNLSGGQQQRTALAMTLAREPKLLLLDEPFSQIDTFRTNSLRMALFNYCKSQNITVITATHDVKDVLPFADKVAVMRSGEIIRLGSPETVYNEPQSYYTASLFGEVNEIPGSILPGFEGGKATVFPHQLARSEKGFEAIVVQSQFQGSHYLIRARIDDTTICFNDQNPIPRGTSVLLEYKK